MMMGMMRIMMMMEKIKIFEYYMISEFFVTIIGREVLKMIYIHVNS